MLGHFDTRLINLPSRSDRRAEFGDQLAAHGLRWSDIKLFPAVRPEEAGGFESIGARGCFMSHLGALKEARGSVLLIEDDLNFAPDFAGRVDATMDVLRRESWGIFYGGHRTAFEPEHMMPVAPELPIETSHMIAFHADVVPRVIAFLEGLLSRERGAILGGPMHTDGAYTWFRSRNPDVITRMAVPELGYQRASRTDVFGLRWHDRVPGVSAAVDMLRKRRNTQRARELSAPL